MCFGLFLVSEVFSAVAIIFDFFWNFCVAASVIAGSAEPLLAENLVEFGRMRGVDRKFCCVFFRGAVFFSLSRWATGEVTGLKKFYFFSSVVVFLPEKYLVCQISPSRPEKILFEAELRLSGRSETSKYGKKGRF